jgi:membrane-associated phospholipid phosphatase
MMTHDNPTEPISKKQHNWRLRGVRLAAIILGLLLWHLTQSMIGQRAEAPGGSENTIVDQAHVLTHDWNQALNENKKAANTLLIISTALIDLAGIWLLVLAIGGKTIRPFVALFILFSARQISQYFCALPLPDGIIWHDPGVPSLLITYGVANDFFFSGHTGIAVLGALELARRHGRTGIFLGIFLGIFEAVTVLALRAHYTMDVIAGAAIAILAALAASRLADSCDQSLNRLAGTE